MLNTLHFSVGLFIELSIYNKDDILFGFNLLKEDICPEGHSLVSFCANRNHFCNSGSVAFETFINIQFYSDSGLNSIAKKTRWMTILLKHRAHTQLSSWCFICPVIQLLRIWKMNHVRCPCQSPLLVEAWIFARLESWILCHQIVLSKVCSHHVIICKAICLCNCWHWIHLF